MSNLRVLSYGLYLVGYSHLFNPCRMSDDENLSNTDETNDKQEPDNTNDDMSLDSNVDLRNKLSNKRRFDERGSVKQRLGRRPSPSDLPSDVDDKLLQRKIIPDLTTSTSDSVEAIARNMAKNLQEAKEELISMWYS